MEDLCDSDDKLKTNARRVARKWQRKVQEWLIANNLTENQYLEHLDRCEKTIPTASPQLNGALKTNQRNSVSDDRYNYPSSSSQEVESPDSQRANQRNIDHHSNHQPFLDRDLSRESSSPSQLEAQNHNSVKLNHNLSIDPQEETPVNKVQESPVKDSFSVRLEGNMFKAVKRKEPLVERNMFLLENACRNVCKMSENFYPEFLKNFLKAQRSLLGPNCDCMRSMNGETENNKDSTHLPSTFHNSHNMPSTSLQGARESSSCPEYKPGWSQKKLLEGIVSVGKAKKLKHELPRFHDGKNLPSTSQAAEESSRNCPGFNNDRKRKHMESTHSFINSREVKLQQQPSQDSKTLSSVSQLGGIESSRTCPVPKHYRKRKHAESSQSVIKADELKEEQWLSPDGKSKHVLRTEFVTKGKETAQNAAKAYEFKDECRMSQGGKVKLDPKRVCAMAFEARNCDKNHINKRDSHDQSAMLAVTSSKKERTSLYHGGRNSNISRLKDICVQTLIKAIKQNSDPLKFIYRPVDFDIIEPVLVLVSPDKLRKIEDTFKYLKRNTDNIWLFFCERMFKPRIHLKKEQENWRTFYYRCCVESDEKLRSVTASITASASKAKPDRQIKLTTVNGPPTKRPKIDNAMVVKNHANNAAIRPLPNPCQLSSSRCDVPVPPKGFSLHTKSSSKTIKKDAPLMHKAKKTLGQLHRIHRN